jgi:ABC-type multidrug transport system fused ATPase/permease subunit
LRRIVADVRAHGHAHEMIMRLPEGYNAIVGEHQRITIARAILRTRASWCSKKTSSLDVESEAAVQSAIEVLMKTRTTIIAHCLSTVVNADRIIVLREGASWNAARTAVARERVLRLARPVATARALFPTIPTRPRLGVGPGR